MKKWYTRWSLMLGLGLWTHATQAQQITAYVSTEGRPCIEDSSVFQLNATFWGTSFNLGDVVSVDLDYGDGQTETKTFTLSNSTDPGIIQEEIRIKHKYNSIATFTGTADISCNGNTLSLTLYEAKQYSGCSSFSGAAYVDYNDNCTLDAIDIPLRGSLLVSGQGLGFWFSPEPNGAYSIYLPSTATSYTMEVYPYNFSGSTNITNCPSNGSYTFLGTSLPMANQDFSVKSNIEITSIWNQTNNIICEEENVCFYIHTLAIGYDSVDLQVNFGDGQIIQITEEAGDSGIYTNVCHLYTTPGLYAIEVIASGAYDADTFITPTPLHFSDSCGDVTGTIYADINNNCVLESNDVLLSGVYVVIKESGTIIQYDFTDVNGIYSFEDIPLVGNYTVEVLNTGNYLPIACPNSMVHSVASVPASGLDFAFDASNVSGFDLASILNIGAGFNRPGQSRYLEVCTRNFGFTSSTGTLELELDPLLEVTSFNNPQPISVSGNTITWDFANVIATNPYSSYDPNGMVCFSMQVLTDTTANIGDTLCLTLTSNPISGDANPTNNVLTLCAPVLNSYDPNDKSVSPSGNTAYGFVANNQTMTYTVRFQNTGNAPAFNVFIIDTIDANLDLSTLQPIASSHAMDVQVYERRVKFMFADINLADSMSNEPASHGFVVYRIAQKANLQPGDVFENTAHIFFDYNPAIVTNTVVNTIESITTSASNNKGVFGIWNVFPNPATSDVTLSFETNGLRTIQLKDVLGKVVRNISSTSNQVVLNISDLTSGMYSVTVLEDGMQSTQKIVVRK